LEKQNLVKLGYYHADGRNKQQNMYDFIILHSFVHWARRINKALKRIRRSENNLVFLENKNKIQDKFIRFFLFVLCVPCVLVP